jgi:predicted acyltransferase
MASGRQTSSLQPTASEVGRTRLLSLDAFRGLTILAMILVNNPGEWGEQYRPLAHARWHGWTPTDLVFPFFLFIVGTSLAYSLRRYRDGQRIERAVYWRIARRTLILIFLGLLPGILVRVADNVFGDASMLSFSTLRFPGVLQRIAVVYCIVSLVALHLPVRAQAILATILLLGYWALLAFLPHAGDYERNLSPDGNVVGLVDRAVFTPPHMYTYDSETGTLDEQTEPEGILSTLPAIVTTLLGYWTGLAIQRHGLSHETVIVLLVCGAACAVAGLAWALIFPINKKIWTSSFVLLTGGLAMQLLAVSILVFDAWGRWRLARPFEIVGVNAIFVFVASGLTATLLNNVSVGSISAHDWLYNTLFASWIVYPKLASLGYALATVGFWWLVAWIMWRLGVAIRV